MSQRKANPAHLASCFEHTELFSTHVTRWRSFHIATDLNWQDFSHWIRTKQSWKRFGQDRITYVNVIWHLQHISTTKTQWQMRNLPGVYTYCIPSKAAPKPRETCLQNSTNSSRFTDGLTASPKRYDERMKPWTVWAISVRSMSNCYDLLQARSIITLNLICVITLPYLLCPRIEVDS